MSVLPSSWRGLCRQSDAAPLKLVPFLPQDNDNHRESVADSSSVAAGGNNHTRASEEALVRANAELSRCLALPFPTFLSFVLEDASLGKFVDTFLR